MFATSTLAVRVEAAKAKPGVDFLLGQVLQFGKILTLHLPSGVGDVAAFGDILQRSSYEVVRSTVNRAGSVLEAFHHGEFVEGAEPAVTIIFPRQLPVMDHEMTGEGRHCNEMG